MPSPLALPTIADHLKAAGSALVGERDRFGDKHRGAIYEHASGPTAVLFAQQAERDQDVFEDIYFDAAQGDALTTLIQDRYGITRILDTHGEGTCSFARSSAAAGAGTILEGTRIQVLGAQPAEFVVAADTLAGASQTVLTVPIRASVLGSGTAIQINGGLRLVDPTYDPLWLPTALTCADGTDFEAANDYRARARKERLANRNGYVPKLVDVCQAAGAAYVVAFPSHYGLALDDFTSDTGVNALYVADANFQSTAALVNACAVALESCRVLGADLLVGGVVQSALKISATAYLIDDPGKLDTVPIKRAIVQTLLAYFAPTQAGYTYKRAAMSGACAQAHKAIQQIVFATPSGDATLSPSSWPANLTRYTLAARDINLTLSGPI